MPVATKKKRSRKASFKANPYPTQESKSLQQHVANPFAFNPSLKTSSFSNRQNITSGGNPIFQFPIPHVDPHKATLLNDEVDMYFPRKHFLSKYQMINDLLENIIIKPIPSDKIIPPRLFPIAFVDGMPYEKKKAELLREVKNSETIRSKPHSGKKSDADANNNEDLPSADQPRDSTVSKDDIGSADNDKLKINQTSENEALENGEEKTNLASANDIAQVKEEPENQQKDNEAASDNAKLESLDSSDDENLSDYDPDFDEYQIPYPKETAEESEAIKDYLTSRVNIKIRTDFLFGDLETMKMQEKSLAETEKKTRENLEVLPDLGERYNFNIKAMDDLHKSFLTYTADEVEESEKKLDEHELQLKSKFKQRFVDSNERRQFQTSAFDAIKTSITLSEYNVKFKKTDIAKNTPQPGSSSASQLPQPQASDSLIAGDEKTSPVVLTDTNSGLLIEQPDSLVLNALSQNLVRTESRTSATTSQVREQESSSTLPFTQKETPISNQIPGQESMGLAPQETSQLNDHDSDIGKGSTDSDEDISKKQSDMNAFLKAQNNFDFDNDMLYDSGDFNNDDNDDDFGSLSNEVFLNM